MRVCTLSLGLCRFAATTHKPSQLDHLLCAVAHCLGQEMTQATMNTLIRLPWLQAAITAYSSPCGHCLMFSSRDLPAPQTHSVCILAFLLMSGSVRLVWHAQPQVPQTVLIIGNTVCCKSATPCGLYAQRLPCYPRIVSMGASHCWCCLNGYKQ